MTEQIPDSCVFDGRRWVVTSLEGADDAIPSNEALGIETVGPSSNNWSGRVNHFMVHEDRLFLFKIEVSLAEASKDVLPQGSRREILLRYEPWEVHDDLGHRTQMKEFRTENLVFDNLPLTFSGVLRLSYPYSDDWELPIATAGSKEAPSVRVALTFQEGLLADFEYLEGEPWARPATRPVEGPEAGALVRHFSRQLEEKIARRVIGELNRMTDTLSGELETTWEEICVQVQGERSFDWDAYDLTVQQVVLGHIVQLQRHEREALWLQTEAGIDWTFQRDDRGADPADVSDDEIVSYLKDDFIYPAAEDWSNERTQAFFERRHERD